MSNAYLLLGGNRGNRIKNLNKAVDRIRLEIGNIIRISSVYETEPYGFTDEMRFLNLCLLVESDLSPRRILNITSGIETSLGRIRKSVKYESRTLDIDILFYDDLILNDPRLIIPHPELHKRNFALIPMAEIDPQFIHPVFGKSIIRLLEESTDKHEVIKFSNPLF
jgi:2-amino-4-hydroxy-6-hydroxymethyldihydropteridine diphosphokinase